MSNILPEDIRSLLTEACALEYCPAEIREWAASVLATGADPPARAHVSSFYWWDFRTYATWALHSRRETYRRHCLLYARNYLESVKRDHDS